MTTAWDTSALPSDTLRALPVPLPSGQVVLSVRGSARTGYIVERRRMFRDAHQSIQRVGIDIHVDDISSFTANEPVVPAPRQRYTHVLDAVRGAPVKRDALPPQVVSSIDVIDLLNRVRVECSEIGVHQCLYHTFMLDGESEKIVLHDTLIVGADAAAWSQLYANNVWFRNDPAVLQARRHNYQPVCASQHRNLPPEHWFHRICEIPAFRGSVAFLARHENAIGILHAGSPLAADLAEPALLMHRHVLSSLTADVLVKYTELSRAESASKVPFDAVERKIAGLLARGQKATEIEQSLQISHSAFRDACRSINSKMGLHDIRLSIKSAKARGLIGSSYD
ncbi:helix-turn-helix transcriptional regulator [Burkholderia stagnalis]|uniref:helix-turn-helix transcriptional regulator n=1 Tax=Burkholderia stagnalis TaxID=1503054 RepID=UPI000F812EC2|nr:LuxR family transcriptional regulator [Burkholderia stagnalis]